jgi:hypothetical protein
MEYVWNHINRKNPKYEEGNLPYCNLLKKTYMEWPGIEIGLPR